MSGPPHQFTERCAIKPRIAGEFRRSAPQDPHHEPIIRNFKSNPPIDAQKAWSSTLKNAELLRFAEDRGFEVLVATDTNLCYQQNLAARQIAFVALFTTSWSRIRPVAEHDASAGNSASARRYVEVSIT